MFPRFTLTAAAVATLFSSSAQAADEVDEALIVVTATRVPSTQQNAAADTTIIYQNRLDGASNLTELLAQDAGAEITTNGGPTSTTGIFIRGTKPAQSAFYIDGFRLINPTDGVSHIEQIPTASLGRVEVVRGSASGLYGSGAIGGVVQLFTRTAEQSVGPDAQLSVGRYGTYNSQVGYGVQFENTGIHVAVSADGSRGTSASNSKSPSFVFEPDNDGYQRRSVSANLTQSLGGGKRLRLTALAAATRTDVDLGQLTGPSPFVDATTKLVGATYTAPIASIWETEVKVGRTSFDYEYKDASFVFAPETSSNQFGWLNHFRFADGTLTAGLEREEQKVTGEGTSYVIRERSIDSAFMQWIGTYGAHGIQAKIRSDRWEDYKNQTTGGLLYSYALTPGFSLTASTGKGFRAPTFDDLYFPFGSNPNLRPERSVSTEMGGRYRVGNDEGRLVVFRNRIHDAIELDNSFIPQNVEAKIAGVTLSWRHNAFGWDWQVALTRQNPEDVATRNLLRRRAKNIGSGRLGRESGAWRYGIEVRAQGERFDSANNAASSRLGGYYLANLYASYAATNQITLETRLDNATDTQYELARGFNTLGRSLFVGVRYSPR